MKRNRLIALLAALLLAAALCGCGLFGGKDDKDPSVSEDEGVSEAEADPEFPVGAGGTVVQARPGKVVSLAPSLTEKLYDLGLEGRLNGVSDYCDYPGDIRGLPACGTAQLPDLEELARLAPHLILTETALPDEAMEVLDELEIPVAVFPHAGSVEELLATYGDLACLMEGAVSGRMMADALTGEFRSRLDRLSGAVSGEESKRVLYLRLLDFTVATGDTFENELMERIGLDNIAKAYTGWEYPAEDAKSADGVAAFASVDIIFMDEEFVTIKDLEQSPFYRGLPATINDRYLYIKSIEMERQSLRTLFLLEDMAAYAYPGADLSGSGRTEEPAEGEPDGEDEADGPVE